MTAANEVFDIESIPTQTGVTTIFRKPGDPVDTYISVLRSRPVPVEKEVHHESLRPHKA